MSTRQAGRRPAWFTDRDGGNDDLAVLAILLYLLLGPHAALAELLAELLIGVALIGGGGGTRARRTLRRFLTRLRSRRTATA